MGTKEKGKGKTGVSQLIIGIVAIAICFAVIVYGYGFLYGAEIDNQVVLEMNHDAYTASLLGLMLFPCFLGIYGGIEIGSYFKQNSQK